MVFELVGYSQRARTGGPQHSDSALWASIRCSRTSTSRIDVEVLIHSPGGPPVRDAFQALHRPGEGIQNALVFPVLMSRSFTFSPSPKRRWKTRRGLFSMGSGVVAELQEKVFMYAQV